MASHRPTITLSVLTGTFVPFALLLFAANVWAELAPFPAHVRTATTIWIAMLFAGAALVLRLTAWSPVASGAFALAWSFGLAAMALHLFFAIVDLLGGDLTLFIERNGIAVTALNFGLVAWWAADVALLWSGVAGRRWMRLQGVALSIALLAMLVASSVILGDGIVRWLGVALVIAVAVAVVVRTRMSAVRPAE